jgi:hypothetical protein
MKIIYKILYVIGLILLVTACKKEVTNPIAPQHIITFTIDSALSSDGKRSLPKDNNGFYHLVLSTTRTQTLTRITGTFLVDGKPNKIPSPVHGNIEWVGSHYWLLRAGESATAIVKTYFNPFTGQLQISQLPNLISQQDQVIPIVNGTSGIGYDDGNINTMAAPVYPMRGDTLTIIAKARYTIEIPVDNLFSKTKVDSIQKSIRIICD